MKQRERLRQLDKDLWCLESHFVVWGCRGSVRMTVIETSAGLLIYSPVRLTQDIIEHLQSLGRIALIIAPNLYHHLFLRPCMTAFPEASVLIPRGLEARIGAIPRAQEITAHTIIGPADEIAHFAFDGHALHETVLFHRPTGTLITADLIYNYGPRQFPAERLFFRAIGCYGAPKLAFYHRFAIQDKQSVAQMMDAVSAWPVRRIVMSHGDIIEAEDAGPVFAKAWSRFAP